MASRACTTTVKSAPEEVVHQTPPGDALTRAAQILLGVTDPASGTRLGPSGPLPSLSPSAISSDQDHSGFRWEAEMTALVASQVHRLMPRGGAHLVVAEVPAAQGIADIVAVRFDTKALQRRLDSGIGPVTSPLRVQVLHALREDRSVRTSTLAAHFGSNASALTRSTLKPLAELGLVELRTDMVRATGVWRPVAAHLTAVELKLSKWRDALRQADNFAVSADRSWLVLDASRSAGAVRESALIGTFGVGLAVVEPTGDLRIVMPPRGRRPERWLRALMAEQAWARAEGAVAAAFAGPSLHEATPAVEMTCQNTHSENGREAVPEGDGGVEPVGNESATVSDGHSGQRRSLLGRVTDLVAFGEREIVRIAHLGAFGAGARLVSGLIHELLVDAPRDAAEELRLEVREGRLLGASHRRREPVGPRRRGHASAESPGAPTHGEPSEPT